jgi:hypothetical protein
MDVGERDIYSIRIVQIVHQDEAGPGHLSSDTECRPACRRRYGVWQERIQPEIQTSYYSE